MNILIAVDDTPESIDAVHFAYRCFGATARYVVASVGATSDLVLPATPMGVAPPVLSIDHERSALREHAMAAAEAARDELPTDAAVEVQSGPVGATICRIAVDEAADVIVIGSHDRGFWSRLVDPSVGRHLTDHAPCAVLTVR